MKTIESLDFPLRVYFKDGECHHDSAVIVFTHGAPAYVRASGPFVVYPWENIKHVIRVADEAQEPDLTARLRASVAAIADERNGAKQEAHTLRAEVERLRALHTEHRLALRAALGLRDDEATDNVSGDFKSLCERVASLRSNYESAYRVAHINADDAHRLSNDVANLKADLASMAEQRDLLKRQIEELRAETRKPALSQAKQVEPGGPIWVRVVDATSKHFGLVGAINGIEYSIRDGREMWSVDLGHTGISHQDASMFAVVGTGRKPLQAADYGTGILLNPPAEPNPDNRDSYRSTALRAGAKDCTLFVGPKPSDLTFVVEMSEGAKVFDVVAALEHEHGLQPEAYRIREVRSPASGMCVHRKPELECPECSAGYG